MWNSTNDKKSEDLDDCSCCSRSSDGSNNTAAGSSSATSSKQKATKQQQNALNSTAMATRTNNKNCTENNSNTNEQILGDSNFGKANDKDSEDAAADAAFETIDSGFISGPQTESETGTFEPEIRTVESDNEPLAQSKRKTICSVGGEAHEDTNVIDSGCIEVGDEEEEVEKGEENKNAFDKDDSENESKHSTLVEGVSSSSQTTLGSQLVAISSAAAATATTTANQMTLKENVDADMSERFCKLSLQNTATTQQQASMLTTEQTESGGAMLTNPNEDLQSIANNQSRNEHQTSSAVTTNITTSNAWEQFYQQNDDGDTPLHLACISGYVDVVAALIRMAPHPCLFNIQNDEAQTALHLAVLTLQPKILRMLLIAGAEPSMRDRHGNTALHLACLAGEEQCVRALTIPISASEINEAHREYGHWSNDKTVSYLSCARLPSDLEIRNYDGERCVHLAAQAGHIDVLRILVLYGADINAREGKSGRTPLHIAIESCNENLANFLLDECLKLNIETATFAGLTAYQVACILNKSQMQNMLEKRGAEPLTPPDSDYDSDDAESGDLVEESKSIKQKRANNTLSANRANQTTN